MKNIGIYTLTSPLHDEKSVKVSTAEFLAGLNIDYDMEGVDLRNYGSHSLDLIYVCTGGTEGLFRGIFDQLRKQSDSPIYLLTSGKSNSLAASMEILSYLRQLGVKGEIIHGDADYVNDKISTLTKVGEAKKKLNGCKLGIIGKPSDWLISSNANREAVKAKFGIELIDIPMEELLSAMPKEECQVESELMEKASCRNIKESLPGAMAIYEGLKKLIEEYGLQGLTIRCFDLLTTLKNTGCIALAKLNSEGIVAGCEGDVPAMLSMILSRAIAGVSGFQANPSKINPKTGEMLVAHCTIPFNLVESYELDTHFESGIGVGIRGYMHALILRSLSLLSNVTDDRLGHPLNALFFIVVTVPGITNEVIALLLNALAPIVVILDGEGSVTFANDVHPTNALSSIMPRF